MNMPDLNEARKRTKDKVNMMNIKYLRMLKILVMVKAMHFLLMDVK